MGLPELLSALDRDAELELERHRTAKAAAAESVRAQAEAEAERFVTDAVAAAEEEATAQVRRELGTGRAHAAAQLRREREAALTAVLHGVRERLDRVRAEPGYADLLSAFLDEALTAVPQADRVHVDPRDVGPVTAKLAARGGPERVVADLDSWGGVIAAAPGLRVDNTLESRLHAAWPRLRSALAATWATEHGAVS